MRLVEDEWQLVDYCADCDTRLYIVPATAADAERRSPGERHVQGAGREGRPVATPMVPRAAAMLLARDAYQWLVRQRIPEPDSPEQVLQAALEAAEERDGDE